ncbi:MAG: TraR/DksA family transcriptional regulator [Pseudoalteromonas prydzensis]|uniref:Conjugal transfer protein TraR n=1 Tax=Pseudoalteromonas prydzensis TaxID=182141 RepID=A0A7V1D1K9_9GAMM|nr:TraR/DksA C4-type zinc finger protein [Pseudoalteromonas prydzensis]HEA18258.1 conjugal transfer protein TraR [Pseudoalteromonas prydzensis]
MINAQHHLQLLNTELQQVRQALLLRLSDSNNLIHHALVATLHEHNPEQWLELTQKQLGTEYQDIILRLEQLEAAVCQIDIGQYGYCCDCEEKIDPQRLNADPTAQRCGNCESKL